MEMALFMNNQKEFVEKFGQTVIKFQLLPTESSLYIWIAEGESNCSLTNLVLFFGSSSSTILGNSTPFIQSIGTKLSTKWKIPLYLSLNRLPKNEMMNDEIDRFIELKIHSILGEYFINS